jgi:pyruvate formate lyase activating enzyme
MASGLVFNIQRFCVHDGPGIRTTVFLKGCPAHCPWCHNPESQSPDPELLLFPERCIECGTCVEVCPHGTDPGSCDACGTCAGECPTDARRLAGRRMTADEVVQDVTRDRPFYRSSGGGVTFSGGEPFAQPEFLRELLALSKEAGLHTAVDTCGAVSRRLLFELAPLIDLFLYDVKLLSRESHREVVGLAPRPILENLRALAACGAAIWLRLPIVSGMTDSREALDQVGRLAAQLGIERAHLLPYHATGAQKWRRLGRPGPDNGFHPPSSATLESLAAILRAHGLETRIGG